MPLTHYQHLPFYARIVIDRLDAASDLRTDAKLNELLDCYAKAYAQTCDDETRASVRYIARRRFSNFPGHTAARIHALAAGCYDPGSRTPTEFCTDYLGRISVIATEELTCDFGRKVGDHLCDIDVSPVVRAERIERLCQEQLS